MRRTTLGLIVVLAACAGDNITDLPGVEVPEDRGTEVVSGVATVSMLAWSPDASEIYFQSQVPSKLMAVNVASGATREIDGPRDDYPDIEASPDGQTIYFSADLQGGARTVYSVPAAGGQATPMTLRSSAVVATRPADGNLALPSRDGSLVAFTALPDSILLTVVATGERRHLGNGCERIIAFSPNNEDILCQTGSGGAGAHLVINIASGATEPLAVLPVIDTRALFMSWNANGIQTIYETPLGFELWDVSTQQRRLSWSLPQRQTITLDRLNGEWSPNGRLIAFWLHECIRRQGLSICLEGQSLLYVADTGNGRSALVAVAHGEEGGTAMAFSPDATQIAYVFENRIYTKPVVTP